MAGDFLRQRIGDQLPGALLVFDPGRVWQGNPDWAPVDQELDVHRIGVAGGDGHYQGLVEAVHLLLGPAVGGGEVSEHKKLKTRISVSSYPANISPGRAGEQTVSGGGTEKQLYKGPKCSASLSLCRSPLKSALESCEKKSRKSVKQTA